MRKYSLIGFGLLTASMLSAQNRSINFDHSLLKDLKAKAQKENKLIFIDAFTTWCGPCKHMAKTVFTNDTAADFYNARFINAKIDMEKGEGIGIAKAYNVTCYPTLLFIDGNGNLVHRQSGSMSVQDFVSLGKTAGDGSRNYSYYVNNYEARKTDAKFLSEYIEAMSGTCLDPEKELALYFSMQSEQDLWSADNWKMMNNYTSDLDSREFNFIVNNKAKLIDLYGAPEVNGKITVVAGNAMHSIIRAKPFDQARYDRARKQIASLGISTSKMILFEAGLNLARKQKDWKSFTELALADADSVYAGYANGLNSIAWDFYENVTDKAALQKAEAWAKRSVELEAAYPNLDTYASLLYKNGKKQEALATAEKAIAYAKQENYSAEEYKPTSELIGKIKAMK